MEDRYISLCVLGIKMWIMLWSQGAYEKFKSDSFKLNAYKNSIICQLRGTKSSTTFQFPYIFFLSGLLKYYLLLILLLPFTFPPFASLFLVFLGWGFFAGEHNCHEVTWREYSFSFWGNWTCLSIFYVSGYQDFFSVQILS